MTIKKNDEFSTEDKSNTHQSSGIQTYNVGETPTVYALTNNDMFKAFVKGIGMTLEPDDSVKLDTVEKRKQFFGNYEATTSEHIDFELGGNFDVISEM